MMNLIWLLWTIAEKDSWELINLKGSAEQIYFKRYSKSKNFMVNHHLLHACSVYFSSGFNDSAILILDGEEV